jgi:hypothetical protein
VWFHSRNLQNEDGQFTCGEVWIPRLIEETVKLIPTF